MVSKYEIYVKIIHPNRILSTQPAPKFRHSQFRCLCGGGGGEIGARRGRQVQQILCGVVPWTSVDRGGQLRDVDPAERLLHLEADSDPEDDEQPGENARHGALRGHVAELRNSSEC